MIRGVTYSEGKIKEISVEKYKHNGNFTWFYCSEATLKELELLSEKTKIPLFEFKHSLDPKEKPRIASKRDYSLIIFRTMKNISNLRRSTYPVEIVINKNFLITLTPERNSTIDYVYADTDASAWKNIQKDGFSSLVFRIIIKLLRDYEKYLDEVELKIDDLEEVSLQAKEEDLRELLLLKRKVFFLRNTLAGNKDMLNEIGEDKLGYIKSNEFYKEVLVDFAQINATEELIKDRLTGVTYEFYAAASNNLNLIMKSFTVIASFILLPTLIASIYGMNLILPLGSHPKGFLIISLIMIVSMIIMFVYFRNKKWV